jgi:hypothetical protein
MTCYRHVNLPGRLVPHSECNSAVSSLSADGPSTEHYVHYRPRPAALRPHAGHPGQPRGSPVRTRPHLKREPCQKPVTERTNTNTTAEIRPIQLRSGGSPGRERRNFLFRCRR